MQPTNIVDDPGFPGYSRATFPDGTSIRVKKDRAVELLGPNSGALAQNWFPQPTQPQQNMTRSDAVASYGPPPPQQFGPPSPPPGVPKPPQVEAGPAAPYGPPAPSPPAPSVPVDPMDPRTGLRMSDYRDAARPVYVAGTPGIDPHRIKATQVAVPVQRSRQVVSGAPYDEQGVLHYQALEREAKQAEAQAGVLQARNQVQTAQLTASELANLQQQQQAEQYARESAYTQRMQGLESEAKEIANTKVDTSSGASGWQTIGLALAAGLTGYATKGGPNWVLNQISEQVNNRIRAQELQIRNRKDANQTELGRLSQEWGSIDAGRAALKVREVEVAKAKLESIALKSGIPLQNDRVRSMMMGLDAIQAKEREQLKQSAAGQATTTEQEQYVTPRKPTAGYYRNPTDKELEARIDRTQGRVAKGQDIVHKGLENQEKEAILTGAIPDEKAQKAQDQLDTRVAQYGERKSAVQAAKDGLARFVAQNGITRDANGDLLPPSDLAGFGRVGKHAPNAVTSQQGINNRAALEAIVYDQVRAAFGAANDKQVEMIADRIIGNGTPTHIASELNVMARSLDATDQTIDASYTDHVRNAYKRNLGSVRGQQQAKDSDFQPVNFGGK